MATLDRIITAPEGRTSQLIKGPGNNQQARASDVNRVIDEVNDQDDRITDIETVVTSTSTVVASSSVTTGVIEPYTSGAGTSIKVPVIASTAFASPTVLTASQSGAICLMDRIAGCVYTLPAATAANTGVRFKFIQTATVTSNASTIQGATSSDLFIAGSSATQTVLAAPTLTRYSPNGSSNYKYSTNGSTTGGIIGDVVEVVCTGLNSWLVNAVQTATGSVATPFAG